MLLRKKKRMGRTASAVAVVAGNLSVMRSYRPHDNRTLLLRMETRDVRGEDKFTATIAKFRDA